MFESEVALEKRSSILPLLLMSCLVLGIMGLVGYVIMQVRGKTPLEAQQATGIVTAALQGPGPAVIQFHTGVVKPTIDAGRTDPDYRLLEKAGLVKLAKAKEDAVRVTLTPDGEKLITGIAGCKKAEEADGAFSYQVPLAQRQFVSIAGVTMEGPDTAIVDYNWKWIPNQLGDVFDAGGPLVKGFNQWERQTLINKFSVAFYHGEPTKSKMILARNGKEWKLPTR